MQDDRADELNELLGRLLAERADDHEAYLREREVRAAAVVELERLGAAISVVVERTKTRLAGIAPSGRAV